LLATRFGGWERGTVDPFQPAFSRLPAFIPSASADGIRAVDTQQALLNLPAMAEALRRSRLKAEWR
jgi:hypothetical protein